MSGPIRHWVFSWYLNSCELSASEVKEAKWNDHEKLVGEECCNVVCYWVDFIKVGACSHDLDDRDEAGQSKCDEVAVSEFVQVRCHLGRYRGDRKDAHDQHLKGIYRGPGAWECKTKQYTKAEPDQTAVFGEEAVGLCYVLVWATGRYRIIPVVFCNLQQRKHEVAG